jgi:probable rRNA maturation factor
MIYYVNSTRGSGIDGRRLKRTVRSLLKAVGEDDSSISVSLVNDDEIRELNKAHRGKDKPTDVLSFPLIHSTLSEHPKDGDPELDERLLGDIVISVDTARRQAEDYDAALQDEVDRLLIHGVLHILGHDHEEAGERARMEAEERRLADAIGMKWPYE